MDCTKWEESGLLYCSGELNSRSMAEYEEHMKECVECRMELDNYRRLHSRFFTGDLLGESPSPETDAEILRVCSMPVKRAAGLSLFPVFLRKSAVPLVLFALAFFTVGYVRFNAENARQHQAASISVPAAPVANNSAADSLNPKDSMTVRKANYAQTRGNLDDKGVITVDLKGK
ncbi:MAG: hypothetical protein MUF22_06920 [Chitinispirillaceae bacterium]|jgi:hypothetical protein|nr:hypothetical protein [Chitinispirillaceae bacterium]